MSEARVIACNNCGSRYKLPPTFQGSKVRCKNCSAVIEIESSIVDPAAPAAKAPAAKPKSKPAEPAKKPAKKPARASSRRHKSEDDAPSSKRGSSARRGSKVSGSRSRRGARAAAADDDDDAAEEARPRGAGRRGAGRRGAGGRSGGRGGARGRRGAEEVEEQSKTPMLLGIGGGVVVLAVALFFIFGNNGDTPNDPGKGNQVAGAPDEAGKTDANKPDLNLPPEEGSGEGEEKVAKKDETAEGKKPEEAAGKNDGEAKEASAKKEPKKEPAKTAKKPKVKAGPGESSTPFDPATETEELAWTEDVTDEEKKEITELVETNFSDDSIHGMRAGRKLAKMGRKAFPAIVNRLRTADYMNEKQHTGAYSLHKTLQDITLGRNAGYNPTIPVTQGAAWWNARTVKGWMRFWTQQVEEGDEDAWAEFIRKRKAKQKAEGDDEDF